MAYDTIVLGVGGMGASACMHLAARGRRVLGIEQFAVGHARGSSHGGSRIVRDCYFEHPDYVPLLLRCNALWGELEARCRTQLVHRPGVLYVAHPDGVAVERSYASGQQHGIACELMTAGETRARFPQFLVPDGWRALFEPGAGFVRPELAVCAHAAAARDLGAEIHEHEAVLDWTADARGVTVRTVSASYSAASLVLTAGAWSARMASALGVPLRPLRIPVAWLAPRDRAACTSPRMPVWYVEPADDAPVYGVPLAPDQGEPDGMKVAQHGGCAASECDPAARAKTDDVSATAAEQERIRRAAERFVPCAAGSSIAGATCLYTMSPDEHFVIDSMPGHANVFIACGFSGHGFKFTPVVGQALADLATDGRTNLPIQFLRRGRFD